MMDISKLDKEFSEAIISLAEKDAGKMKKKVKATWKAINHV